MDYVPVPLGMPPAAALTARGAEHEIHFPLNHTLIGCAFKPLRARPALGMAGHVSDDSSVADLLADLFFYNNPAVGQFRPLLIAIHPAKYELLWQQLETDGFDSTVTYAMGDDFIKAALVVVDGLNHAALPAAYMLAPGDFHAKEALPLPPPPPVIAVPALGGGIAAAVPVPPPPPPRTENWLEFVDIDMLSVVVDLGAGGPPLKRSASLGRWWYYFLGGFHSANRDADGSPARVLAHVMRLGALGAGATDASDASLAAAPAAVAQAVAPWFISIQMELGARLDMDAGLPHELSRRVTDFKMLHYYTCGMPASFRMVVGMRFGTFRHVAELVSLLLPVGFSSPGPQAILGMLDVARSSWFSPGKAQLAFPADLTELEAQAALVLAQVDADMTAATGQARVTLAGTKLQALRAAGPAAAGAVGGGGGASAAAGVNPDVGELFRRLSLPAFTALAASAQAVLARTPPAVAPGAPPAVAPLVVDSVALSRLFISSDIPLVKKFGMGYTTSPSSLPSHRQLFRDAAPHVAKWTLNLTRMVIDEYAATKYPGSPVRPEAYGIFAFTDSESVAVRSRRDAQLEWEQRAYDLDAAITRTNYAPIAAERAYTSRPGIDDFVIHFVRAVEKGRGDAPGRVNSLASGFVHLGSFLSEVVYKAPPASQPGYIEAARLFIRQYLKASQVFCGAAFDLADPLVPLPVVNVPDTDPCWAALQQRRTEFDTARSLMDAVPQLFQAVGIDTSSIVQPPDVLGIGSSLVTALTRGARASSSKRPHSPAPPEFTSRVGCRSHELVLGPAGSFGYSPGSELIKPSDISKKTGVPLDAQCWKVVCSNKAPEQAVEYCDDPGAPGHEGPFSIMHIRKPEVEGYLRHKVKAFEGRGFEGGRRRGDDGRDRSPSRSDSRSVSRSRSRSLSASSRRSSRQSSPDPGDDGGAKDAAAVSSPPPAAAPVAAQRPTKRSDRSRGQRRRSDDSSRGDRGRDRDRDRSDRSHRDHDRSRRSSPHASNTSRNGGARSGVKKAAKAVGFAASVSRADAATFSFSAPSARPASASSRSPAAAPPLPALLAAERIRSTAAHVSSLARSLPLLACSAARASSQLAVRLLVVALASSGPPLVLVPPSGSHTVGSLLAPSSARSSAVAAAKPWAESVRCSSFDSLSSLEPFLAAERVPTLLRAERLVVAPVALPPNCGLPLCRSPRERLAASSSPLAWCSLSALGGTDAYGPASVCIARALTYRGSVSLLNSGSALPADESAAWAQLRGSSRAASRFRPVRPDAAPSLSHVRDLGYRVGAVEPRAASGPAGSCALVSDETFDNGLARGVEWGARLRNYILDLPFDYPFLDYLHECADCIVPLDPSDVPLHIRNSRSLPSFLDPCLSAVPFSTRSLPPVTLPLQPHAPQAPIDCRMPRDLADMFPAGYFKPRFDEWYARHRDWMLTCVAARKAELEGHPPIEIPPRPKELVFSQGEMLPQYRRKLFEFAEGGGSKLLDLMERMHSHLDIDFLCSYASSFPDQRAFGSLIYGVQLTGADPFDHADGRFSQVVFSSHMPSFAKGYDKIESELARRAKLGWYGVFCHSPYGPWQGSCFGAVEKSPKGCDKWRQVVDGTAPRNLLFDADGLRVCPVNVAASRDEDAERGTHLAAFVPWDRVLRSTAGSPPPAPSFVHDDFGHFQLRALDASVPEDTLRSLVRGFHHRFAHLVVDSRRSSYDVFGGRSRSQHPCPPRDECGERLRCDWGNRSALLAPGAPAHVREAAVCCYAIDLLSDAALVKASRALAGKILGCFCSPRLCHCHVLGAVAQASVAELLVWCAAAARASRAVINEQLISAPPPSDLDALSELLCAPCDEAHPDDDDHDWLPSPPGLLPLDQLRVLHLFSGPLGPDSLSHALDAHVVVDCVDPILDARLNLFDDRLFERLCDIAEAAEYGHAHAGIPCGTFSILQYRQPPELWLRERRLGDRLRPSLGWADAARVADADSLVSRTCVILTAIHRRGGTFTIENPCDRGGGQFYRWEFRMHMPLWRTAAIVALLAEARARLFSFHQCMLGSPWQKGTTIAASSSLEPHLAALRSCLCPADNGGVHRHDGRIISRAASLASARYPSRLVSILASAIAASLRNQLATSSRSSRLAASSPIPRCTARDLEIAHFRDEPKRVGERKMDTVGQMSDICVLSHVSRRIGLDRATRARAAGRPDACPLLLAEPVYVGADDFADWFYQARLCALDRTRVGYLVLATKALLEEGALEPEMRQVAEYVVGQGTVPGSEIGQCFCALVLHIYRIKLDELEHDGISRMRAAEPEFARWLDQREQLSIINGHCEARRTAEGGYTDDTFTVGLGVEARVNSCVAWAWTTTKINLFMADKVKRQLGVHVLSLGVRLDAALGIAFVHADKVERALSSLADLTAGRITVAALRSLLGLLVHLRFLAGMRKHDLHGAWSPWAEGGTAEDGPSALVSGSSLTPRLSQVAKTWTSRLSQGAGAALTSAVPQLSRLNDAQLARRVYWRSDASREGARVPAVAGIRGAEVWVYSFSAVELELLPIAVTEFAGHYGNAALWGPSEAPDTQVVAELDALASPSVLQSEHSSSPLMQHILSSLDELEGYERLLPRLVVAHIYGEANPTADAPSRGNFDVLHELLAQLGMVPKYVEPPPQLARLMAELCSLALSLKPNGANLSSTSRGVHNINMDGRPIAQTLIDTVASPPPSPVAIASPASSPPAKRARLGLVYDAAPAPKATACAGAVLFAAATSVAALVAPPAAAFIAVAGGALLSTEGAFAPRTVLDSYAALPSPQSVGLPSVSLVHSGIVLDIDRASSGGSPVAISVPLASTPPHVSRTWPGGGAALDLANSLSLDSSPYALRPSDSSLLYSLVSDTLDPTWDNEGSTKKVDSDFRLWEQYCSTLHTPAWRPDYNLLGGMERQREAILAAGFLPWALTRMRGRKGPRALPSSAYKKWLSVVKRHGELGIQLCPSKLVCAQVKRLCRKHIAEFGASSLVPTRKEPMSRLITLALIAAPDNFYGTFNLVWNSPAGRAIKALILVLASSGMRKSEVSSAKFDRTCASRADLVWHLRGKAYASPPAALLANPQDGDFATLKPPLSKADQFGEVWGASPIYISFLPGEPLCAFSALADVELKDAVEPKMRATTPLISPDGRAPFLPSTLDALLRKLLALPTVVGPAKAKSYSWHSFRIGLATSLLASGASRAMILALCRWQTEESLNIYARLDRAQYAQHISRALRAEFFTARTTTIDFEIDGEANARDIYTTVDAGLTG